MRATEKLPSLRRRRGSGFQGMLRGFGRSRATTDVSATPGSTLAASASRQTGKRMTMDLNNKIARAAGVLYLIVVVTGIFSLVYVPAQLAVRGDALATVNNIAASEPLFRLGIVSLMINQIAFLLLPLVLYRLLRKVNKNVAVLMVIFAVVSVPISMVSIANRLDVLSLLSDAGYLQTFTTGQLHAEVMMSLTVYSNGILVTTIFWGLWLLPFGYLVFGSGFLPRVLGILLMIGCFGILIDVFGRVLFPGYAETAVSTIFEMSSSFGEIGICLWLLIFGVRKDAAG